MFDMQTFMPHHTEEGVTKPFRSAIPFLLFLYPDLGHSPLDRADRCDRSRSF